MSTETEVEEIQVYNLDLDEEVIGHLAIAESVKELWVEDLDLDLILDPFTREVYEWQFQHLREHGVPATASVLADEFDLEFEQPLTAPGDLAQRLRERYMKKNGRGYMERAAEAYKEDPFKLVEVLPQIARELQAKVARPGEIYTQDDLERTQAKYNDDLLKGQGPSMGFREVTTHFGGVMGLNFTIGAPKSMKSWIETNRTVDNVWNDGKNVWFYPLELPAYEQNMRILCLAADVPYWKFIRRELTDGDWARIKDAEERCSVNGGSYTVKKPPSGHRSFEEMIERAGEGGADLVIIDQLQYVENAQGKILGSSDTTGFWQPLNAARDLSDDIPIVIVHQFNRSVMGADKMPEMQQAKGSSSIEEVATLALGLWANKDMRSNRILEMGTLAARNHEYEAWEIEFQLSKGCSFELLGRVDHDEDDDDGE